MLEERFGIHPVFPLNQPLGKDHAFHDHNGIPYCAKHGVDEDGQIVKGMHAEQPRDFMESAKRRKKGLAFGEPADLFQAHHRWICEDCAAIGVRLKPHTHWNSSPLAHPYLPYTGDGVRAKRREALMLRRNAVESLNARLKHRGIGNDGKNAPTWVASDREMTWLAYGASLAFTLQRLAHATGAYDEARAEADKRGLPYRLFQ